MPILDCTCSCGCNNTLEVPDTDYPISPYLIDEEVLDQLGKQICSDCYQNIHYKSTSDDALNILRKRLALGEISIEEFDDISSRL